MKKILLFCLTCLLSTTCFSQNLTKVVSVKAKDIKSIGILPVISSVNILKSDDEKISQDFINQTNSTTNRLSEHALDSLFSMINLESRKMVLDSNSMAVFTNEIEKYFTFIKSQNTNGLYGKAKMKEFLERISINDSIAEIIKSQNLRYGLCLINNAFTRTIKGETIRQAQSQKKNMQQAVLGSSLGAIGGLIYGLSNASKQGYQTEFAFGITSYAFFLDAETKKVVNFFILTTDSDPLNSKLIHQKQIIPLFNDYWVWYHSEADQYMKIDRK
jgi:hypothetical protein